MSWVGVMLEMELLAQLSTNPLGSVAVRKGLEAGFHPSVCFHLSLAQGSPKFPLIGPNT